MSMTQHADPAVATEVTEEDIQDWLIVKVAAYVDLPEREIALDKPFTHYGLGSRDGLKLSGELETWLGRELPPSLIWEYPTIEQVARFAAGGEVASELDGAWDEDPGW